MSVHKLEPQDPSKLQPRSVKILSPCQESRQSRERGSQKGTLAQNTAKIDSAAAKEWNLKIRCQEFIVSTWNLPEERTAALPLLPSLPPEPRCRESDGKREKKKEMPLGKMPLYTDCWACFPHPESKQMLASIPVRTYALAKCFAGCLCCQNYNKVCLEFEGKT